MKDQPIAKYLASDKKPALDKYFAAAIKTQASDLHLKGDEVPRLRTGGHLRKTTGEALSEEQVEAMVLEILSPEQKEFFLEHGTLDFAYDTGHTDLIPYQTC